MRLLACVPTLPPRRVAVGAVFGLLFPGGLFSARSGDFYLTLCVL